MLLTLAHFVEARRLLGVPVVRSPVMNGGPQDVVMLSPVFDDDLVRRAIDSLDRLLVRLILKRVEDFAVEQFVKSFELKLSQ